MFINQHLHSLSVHFLILSWNKSYRVSRFYLVSFVNWGFNWLMYYLIIQNQIHEIYHVYICTCTCTHTHARTHTRTTQHTHNSLSAHTLKYIHILYKHLYEILFILIHIKPLGPSRLH